MLAFLALLGAPYIYDISSLRVKVPVPQPQIIQITCLKLVWTKATKKNKEDN